MPELSQAERDTRHEGMGSTDVVEVCGLSPWDGAGPWRVYNAKIGITQPSEPTPEQKWGHWQESLILDWYRATVSQDIIPAGHIPSDDHPWLWATLDAVRLGQSRNIEVKNVGAPSMYRHWDTSDGGGIPQYVRAQVQIGMHVRHVKECDVVAAIGGRPPHVWTIGYDAELAGMLIDRASAFWTLVRNRTPPPPDDSDAVREYLRAKYPKDEREMIVCPPELEEVAAVRIAAAIQEVKSVKAKREADALLMTRLGDARGFEGDGWSFTWKCDKNGKRATRFTVRGE